MLRRLLANALALTVTALVVPGIHLTGDSLTTKALTVLGVALIFGLLNAFVRPLIRLVSTPLILLTLGLFVLVINMLMLMLTSWICSQAKIGFHVDTWFAAFLGSLLISAVSWVVGTILKKRNDDQRHR